MTDLLVRVRDALADRYAVERELGSGGMAVVFLAVDRKHRRNVALKVLRPELAAALGPDRFLREIEVTASLHHPNILPLYDSGDVDGLLFYVLPYLEGESLAARLGRERQLPIDDALQIAREIADALSYAHSRGIVHRDIKPDNILFAGSHAVVADFGIARAVSEAGGPKLTETGLALGTPAYMSPEQATGEPVDSRTDLYALGAVLYEMLAGEPPFAAPTAQAIIARRLSEAVPTLRNVRDTIPPVVDAAVRKALAKVPADRFRTADEFASALTESGAPAVPDVKPARWTRRRRAGLGTSLVLLAAATLVAVLLSRHRDGSPDVTQNTVAIMPFRVSGPDGSIAFLREGMLDVLAPLFSGDGGVRSVDAHTLMSAWRRRVPDSEADLSSSQARELAADLGAGLVLLGQAVGTSAHMVVTASLLETRTGEEHARSRAQGPADSVWGIAEHLTAGLLARDAGEYRDRLRDLTSRSLPALQTYIDAQAAYRRGDYLLATSQFARTLDLDSTFALAALGFQKALNWTNRFYAQDMIDRATELGWRYRDRLDRADSALLVAFLGPAYPSPSSLAAQLEAFRHAVRVAPPDRMEPLFHWADYLFHNGALVGVENAASLAADGFHRALRLDSTSFDVWLHLRDHYAATGDSAGMANLMRGAPGRLREWLPNRVIVASVTRDRVAYDSLLGVFGDLEADDLYHVIWGSYGTPWMEAADSAMAILERRDAPFIIGYTLMRGRPRRALAQLRAALGDTALRSPARIWDALWADGDRAIADTVAESVGPMVNAPLATAEADRRSQVDASCSVAMWRLEHGDTVGTAAARSRLRQAATPPDPWSLAGLAHVCALAVEAWRASIGHRADARQIVTSLDSVLAIGPPMSATAGVDVSTMALHGFNQLAARLLEMHGDVPAALAAVRRRVPDWAQWNTAPMWLAEGRLAARSGDTAGAIRAYEHYLQLRSNPEPVLVPLRDQARRALAGLRGGRPR